jgi:MFS family permease
MSIKNRDFWLCLAASFGVTGMNVAFTGYLPTYLQNSGWQGVTSSLALTLYLVSGVVGGFVLLTISDIAHLRKIFFIIPALIWICAIGSMSVLKENIQIWTLVLIAGFTYGSLLAILALIITEIKGIGVRYAGTANSISFAIGGGAGMIFAVLGGKLALTNAVLPFIFAPLFCLVCIIPFFFTRETGIRNSNISHQE